jgi:D-aminoacyl-tRNA deacylase
MRLLIQRVSNAQVSTADGYKAAIGKGLLVFVGIEEADDQHDLFYCVSKLCSMRIFADNKGKLNLDINQVEGEILVVSQFTLHASTKKGNRPSFIKAARPEMAAPLYEQFLQEVTAVMNKACKSGVFGANMQISLINDGPVTIIVDSKTRE